MLISLSNKEVYNIVAGIVQYWGEIEQASILPTYINYCIQYNYTVLLSTAELVDKMRLSLGQKYGVYDNEDNSYHLNVESTVLAEKELNDILAIVQEYNIKTIKLSSVLNIPFTPSQMQILLFMIEDDVSKIE